MPRWIAISERDANFRGFAAIILTSRPGVAIHQLCRGVVLLQMFSGNGAFSIIAWGNAPGFR
ncbi:MAG TPA: hypothetical protein VFD18_05310 [Chthoniobacterales bacterium]|nr:hypothetical protein [Chthoniobacterales bacterium]